MIFNYKAITGAGVKQDGTIDAISMDAAIAALQRQGLILSSVVPAGEKKNVLNIELTFLNRVTTKDVVILSRQLATLFSAQVSALRIFRLLADQVENPVLRKHLIEVSDDLQGGSSISNALAKHPQAFSDFYVNMVRAGEESGKLDETFEYLADYLDRTYEVTSKAKNALIYPAFVITTFIGVMILMFTVIIPKIALMITDSGQQIPIYTRAVLGVSGILINYGLYVAVVAAIGGFFLFRYLRTDVGKRQFALFKLEVPYVGNLYKKLYLSRIADNMATMTGSGIPMLHALEITGSVVDNDIYKEILDDALKQVKAGVALSTALARYDKQIPGIMTQMIKVGEESGELSNILKTLAKFYGREVINAVDTLVALIEPVMIVALGVGVGLLLASVLVPIYNIAATQ